MLFRRIIQRSLTNQNKYFNPLILSNRYHLQFCTKKDGPTPPSEGEQNPEINKEHVKKILQQSGMEEEEQQEKARENSTGYIYALGAIGLVVGYLFMQLNLMSYQKKVNPRDVKVKYSGQAQIGGPWKLITTDGSTMTHLDMKGTYYLIYFGFCNCPDICPNQLFKLSKALARIRKLPEGKLMKLQPIFVTVDPDRDSPERIKKFLSHFDPSFIGLTGKSNDDPDLREAMRNFKIYASKIKYEMDEEEARM